MYINPVVTCQGRIELALGGRHTRWQRDSQDVECHASQRSWDVLQAEAPVYGLKKLPKSFSAEAIGTY